MKKRNFYTSENLQKMADALQEAMGEVKSGSVTAVSVSHGNVKMGAVPSVSTLPFLTCPGRCKGTCGKECYAAKIALLRPSVMKSYARNTALLMLRPDVYWAGVEYAVKGNRFFRLHVSGDIRNDEDFAEITGIAARNTGCQILMLTKRWEVVNTWIDENGDLPENLHVLFSGWEGLETINPHNLPETNVYGQEGPQDNWLLCGGNCYECGCRGTGCWMARKGDIIAFKKH